MHHSTQTGLSRRYLRGLPVLFFCVVLCATLLSAQEAVQGQIQGKVWGATGKPLTAAPVVVRERGGKLTFEFSTTDQGEFRFSNLPSGQYELTVEDGDGDTWTVPVELTELQSAIRIELDFQKRHAAAKEYEAFRRDLLARSEASRENEERVLALRSSHNRGIRLLRSGRPEEALAEFDRILESDPSREDVMALRASCLAASGRTDEAMALYQELLTRSPREASNHNNLAILLARAGRTNEAVEHFERAVKIDKMRAGTYHFNLGSALYEAGRFQDSAKSFRKAIKQDPTMSVAHFFHAAAMLHQGVKGKDRSRAASALRRYLQLDPDGRYANTARDLLEQMNQGVERLMLPEAPSEEDLEW